MMKLVFLAAIGIAATFAADSTNVASNYPYRQDYYRNDPYYRNNYYQNDPYYRNNQYRNQPYNRNNYYRNNDYYNNDNYNNNYYNNDYNRYNRYDNNYRYNSGPEASARILNYDSSVNPDGSYSYSYSTDNGISASESGSLRYFDQENSAVGVQGHYDYISPEGIPVNVNYVADENGFRPEGNILPNSGFSAAVGTKP